MRREIGAPPGEGRAECVRRTFRVVIPGAFRDHLESVANLILLATSRDTSDAVRRALGRRLEADGIVVTHVEGALAGAIEAAREEHGSVPIGVATRSPPEAIEAIELDVDEAMSLDGTDVAQVNELLDRTRIRGARRAETERAKVAVAHAEKLAALGTLVAGVAHEINNPLTSIMLLIDVLPTQFMAAADALDEIVRARNERRGLDEDEVVRVAALSAAFGTRASVRENLDEMRAASRTILEIVKDLRVFAHADDTEAAQVVHVPSLIEQTLRLVGREIMAVAILERDYGTDIPHVLVPHSRITQVLTNVFVNTTHALREVQRDPHRVRITLRADEDFVAISISDTGPGVPPSALERIFDPFYTTRRASLGTGLGLSISRNLMRRMGGDLLVESVFGEGATFIILVPRSSPTDLSAAQSRAGVVAGAREPQGRLSVLIVDTNAAMLRAYSRVLGPRYDLILASDSQEAIELLSSGSAADVVVAELGLSPLDGAHLHQWLTEHRPSLARRTVFVSAEPHAQRSRRELAGLPNAILAKPMSADALTRAVEGALARGER